MFLENSESAYDAEERNKVKLQKKALKRSRSFAIAMGIAAIFLLGILVWAFMQYIEADTQRKKADSALARQCAAKFGRSQCGGSREKCTGSREEC